MSIPTNAVADSPAVRAQIEKDLEALRSFVEAEVSGGRQLPWDVDDLYERGSAANKNSGPLGSYEFVPGTVFHAGYGSLYEKTFGSD